MSSFDVFEDDPLEQRLKSTIADYFYGEQQRKLEQARSLAVSLEGENASLQRALFEAESYGEQLRSVLKHIFDFMEERCQEPHITEHDVLRELEWAELTEELHERHGWLWDGDEDE